MAREPVFFDCRDLSGYSDIIDVRSPAEFADDHIPGAINAPVLSNDERIEVGTLFKQVSPFVARRRGAALVSQNIAHHLRTLFHDKPPCWRPLVLCWRGGQRSGAMTHVLRAVGWHATQMPGGYKTWRRHVIDELTRQPQALRFRVISGPTGSGKSALLHHLAEAGEQVLDLEALARHRGSVLGNDPELPQPTQRYFESQLYAVMRDCDPGRPVYVEAESRRIGLLHLPLELMTAIRQSPCFAIEASVNARVHHLKKDYLHLIEDQARFETMISRLHAVHSRQTLEHWVTLSRQGDIDTLVTDLLTKHYDPLYRRSSQNNFEGLAAATVLPGGELGATDFKALVTTLRSA